MKTPSATPRFSAACLAVLIFAPVLLAQTPILFGTSTGGRISKAHTQDTFAFPGTPDQSVEIQISWDNGNTLFVPTFDLVSPAGTTLTTVSAHYPGATRLPLYRLPMAGTYKMVCRDESGGFPYPDLPDSPFFHPDRTDNAGYRITLVAFPGPNPADEDGGELTLGQTRQATIEGDDLDVFTFSGTADQKVTIQMTGGGGAEGSDLVGLIPTLTLISPEGVLLATAAFDFGEFNVAVAAKPAQLVAFRLPITGTYSILCEGYRLLPVFSSDPYAITLGNPNGPPVLNEASISDAILHPLAPFSRKISATDPDPGQTLTYTLVGQAPLGATLDPVDGILNWTPPGSLATGAYPVTVKVTDNGIPPLGDTRTFTLDVRPAIDVPTQSLANAWQIADISNLPGSGVLAYTNALTSAQKIAATNSGWHFTVVSRLVKGSGGVGPSQFMIYGNGTRRFTAGWDTNGLGQLSVTLGGAGTVLLTAAGQGTAGYHRHELVYDPVTALATYLFDGAPLLTSPGEVQSAQAGLAYWGSGASVREGTMNYHHVEFAITGLGTVSEYFAGFEGNPVVAPDPVTQGWGVLLPVTVGAVIASPVSPDTANAPVVSVEVTSTNDDGPGSLRQALKDVASGGAITFDPSLNGQTIILTTGELVIDKNLSITGPGANQQGISGGTRSRVLNVPANTSVKITGLTIRDGRSAATLRDGEDGGGVLNLGELTLDSCVLTGNQTADGRDPSGFPVSSDGGGNGGRGGAIFNGGSLVLTACHLLGNTTGRGSALRYLTFFGSGGDGGGIFNDTSATLQMQRCVVSTNKTGDGVGDGSGGAGGGVFSRGTNLVIVIGTSFAGNATGHGGDAAFGISGHGPGGFEYAEVPSGEGGEGGAVSATGPVRFEGCGFFGNQTGRGGDGVALPNGGAIGARRGGSGGGVSAYSGAEIANCTFSGNRTGNGGDSPFGPADAGSGGAIQAVGTVALRNCTVVNNAAGGGRGAGGGLASAGPNSVSVANTILALNLGTSPDVAGAVTSLGHNLVGILQGSTGFGVPGDLTGTVDLPLVPGIGLLADNGGPTLTHALTLGSPAINAGSNDLATDLPYDQRGVGFPRRFGGAVDIGAYEFNRAFTGIQWAPTGLGLRLQGPPNVTVQLQRNSDLNSTGWETIHSGTTDASGKLEYTDTNAIDPGDSERFYRVIEGR